MSKFSQIAKGAKARHVIQVPFGGGPKAALELDKEGNLLPTHGDAVLVDVAIRILASEEHAEVAAAAHREALAAGLSEEAITNGLRDLDAADDAYRIPRMQHAVFRACVDAESDEEPFFDGGLAQVRKLDRDTLIFLHRHCERFEESVSPAIRNASPEAFTVGVMVLAAEDEVGVALPFFEQHGPGMQWSYVRFLALQHALSLRLRSLSGLATETAK